VTRPYCITQRRQGAWHGVRSWRSVVFSHRGGTKLVQFNSLRMHQLCIISLIIIIHIIHHMHAPSHHPSPIIILSYYNFIHFIFQQTPIHHSCIRFRGLYTFSSFVALYIAGGSSIGLFRPISGDMEYCSSHHGRGIEHKPRKKFTKPERGNGTIRKFFVLYKDREQGVVVAWLGGGRENAAQTSGICR
jgi:hypothetical protein